MLEFISQPWHWSISGAMIALVMFLLIYMGQRFGVSSSFRAMCSIGGAGNAISYFDYDWKAHDWLLTFILGAIIGGGIAINFLGSPAPVQLSTATVTDLQALGISVPQTTAEGTGYLPRELFNFDAVIGFFIGGLLLTHILLPMILAL